MVLCDAEEKSRRAEKEIRCAEGWRRPQFSLEIPTVNEPKNKGQLDEELPFSVPRGGTAAIAWPGLRQVIAERGPDHVVDGVRAKAGPRNASGGVEVVAGPAVLGDVRVGQTPLGLNVNYRFHLDVLTGLHYDLWATLHQLDAQQQEGDIMGIMAKDVIHISDRDAANDFASLLARVREGAEVVIEHDSRPVAVVRPADTFRGRFLSESIALAKAHAKELGYEPTLDPDFAADMKEIIENHRKPLNPPAWD
jgi:prevent-host-death family protein